MPEPADAMTEACIAAGQAVMAHGSAPLRCAMRVALLILAHEISQQNHETDPADRLAHGGGSGNNPSRS